MDWLNFHHLRYFWMVAKEGNLRLAAEKLHVSQPSISAQLKLLEESLGEELFRRSGRSLTLTDAGQLVFSYADEIFSIGRELLNSVKQRPGNRPIRLTAGITDTLPKLTAYKILSPVLRMEQPVHLVCREGKLEDLLTQLATHRLDLVIADEPAPSGARLRAFNHPLGSCGVCFCAKPELAKSLRKGFPGSLHGAPAVLPADNTALRMALERWMDTKRIRPNVIAEFEDAALLKVAAAEGIGITPIHAVGLAESERYFGLELVGHAEGATCQFYAITVERRIKHPAVVALTGHATETLFAEPKKARPGVTRQKSASPS